MPVRKFTQTILRNPMLGRLVRSLVLSDGTHRRLWLGKEVKPISWKAYAATVQSASRDEDVRRPWMQNLEKGNEDAWTALLLVLLKNLQKLELLLPRISPHLTLAILGAANSPSSHLTHLRHLEIEMAPDPNNHALTMDRVLPFLKLPSLRSITTRGLESGPFELEEDLDITSVCISDQDIFIPEVPKLIARCQKLERFEHLASEEAPYILQGVSPFAFYDPLYKSRDTLKILSLKMDTPKNAELWQRVDSYPERRCIGDLTEFSVLETLQIKLTDLVEFHSGSWEPVKPLVDSLPSSLVTLVIFEFYAETLHYMIDHLSELAGRCSGRFSQLLEVVIWPLSQENNYSNSTPVRESLQPHMQGLARVAVEFLEQGVEFRFGEYD